MRLGVFDGIRFSGDGPATLVDDGRAVVSSVIVRKGENALHREE